jgi:hypothetical protein
MPVLAATAQHPGSLIQKASFIQQQADDDKGNEGHVAFKIICQTSEYHRDGRARE